MAREMAKAEAEAMTKEMIAAQVRAEEERKAAAAAAEAVAVAAARARRKARAEAKRVAAAAEAAARAAAAEADRQNKRLMALGAACAVGLLLLVLMVFRGVRDAASTPITQEPAVPSAAAAVPAPHDKKKEQRAAAKRRAAQRKKAAWEQDAGNAQKLEEASLKKEASLKVAAHVPTERPLSPDSDLPPPPTAAADERDAKREAASSRYRRVLTAFKAGRIFSVATRRRAASLARGAASRARDSTDVAQAAPAPAPTPIPARRMAPTPIHPPNSPLGRFEAAVIRALKAGPGGVLTFRMTLQSLSPPPSMVPTLRLTTMRLTAQMLTGSREVDIALAETTMGALIGVLHSTILEAKVMTRDALFFPSLESKARMVRLLRSAQISCDVCVFTITDDEICDALLGSHRRGVRCRVISDDEQAVTQKGSVVFRLAEAGIPTVVDDELLRPRAPSRRSLHRVERNMHHKFAVIDSAIVLTGSFNWTRAAAAKNVENLLVTSAPEAVAAYAAEFEKLWSSFSEHLGMSHHAAAVRIQAILRGKTGRKAGGGVGAKGQHAAAANPVGAESSYSERRRAGASLRRKSMSSQALAEQAVLQVRFGEVVDGIFDRILPEDGAVPGITDAQMVSASEAVTAALNKLPLKPRQAGLLLDTALSHAADRFVDGDVARGSAHLRLAAAILGSIELALFQPPSFKDFLFFPSDACRDRLLSYIHKAAVSVEVAIFSLTDDRICEALVSAHRRGVRVRVISDNETALNEGSDVMKLAEAGVATVVDCDLASPARSGGKGHQQGGVGGDSAIKRHMHNKVTAPTPRPAQMRLPALTTKLAFCSLLMPLMLLRSTLSSVLHAPRQFVICDSHLLLTGSFNFTYAASSKNYENLMATDDSFFVQRYCAEFEKLWKSFWGSTYEDQTTRQQAVVTLQAIHRGRRARKSIVAIKSMDLGMESFPSLG